MTASLAMSQSELRADFLSQACVRLEYGGIRIASDPWFSGPTHLGSWESYPPLSDSQKREFHALIDDCQYIYVSHDHEDHFDPPFLKSLKSKTILVSDYKNGTFNRDLNDLEPLHRIVRLKDGEVKTLSEDVTVKIVAEKPSYRTNSIMLFSTPAGSVLNGNDCALNSADLEKISSGKKIRLFLYTLNFLANGYPFPYLRRDASDTLDRIEKVKTGVLNSFVSAQEILKPELCAAFAGPVKYADGVNSYLNELEDALDWTPMVTKVSREYETVWPAPGSRLLFQGDQVKREILPWPKLEKFEYASPTRFEGQWSSSSKEEALKLAEEFAQGLVRVANEAGMSLDVQLLVHCVPTVDNVESTEFEWSIAMDLSDVGIKKARASLLELGAEFPKPNLQLTSVAPILTGFLKNEINWHSLLVSASCRMSRDPEVFNDQLHLLLRFSHDDETRSELLKSIDQKSKTSEKIEVEHNGKIYQVPKYCPHEAECFDPKRIENGLLVCPRHRWAFDLETGDCKFGDKRINLYDE